MLDKFQRWYGTLSPRRRTGYGVLVAVIVATIPCYCIGGFVLTQGLPLMLQPKVQPTAVPLPPTPTAVPTALASPTESPKPNTPTPTETVLPTPTQMPTLTHTPTAAPEETATETATVTPTETPTETPTATATPSPTATSLPTATSTPAIAGTIQPLPQLRLEPSSGPEGTNVTISGHFFGPLTKYLVYWDSPEQPIGLAVTDELGQISSVVYTVPSTGIGRYQVVVELDGMVVARASFTVLAP